MINACLLTRALVIWTMFNFWNCAGNTRDTFSGRTRICGDNINGSVVCACTDPGRRTDHFPSSALNVAPLCDKDFWVGRPKTGRRIQTGRKTQTLKNHTIWSSALYSRCFCVLAVSVVSLDAFDVHINIHTYTIDFIRTGPNITVVILFQHSPPRNLRHYVEFRKSTI